MGSGVIIRRMEVEDVAAAVLISQDSHTDAWPEEFFELEVAAQDRMFICAEVDGSLAGYGGVVIASPEATIHNVAVAHQHRRKGLATGIMLGLISSCKDRGVANMELEVRYDNLGARALYQRFGFVPAAIRPEVFEGVDALVMRAYDLDSPSYSSRLSRIQSQLKSAA